MNDTSHDGLIAALGRLGPMPAPVADELRALFRPATIRRGEHVGRTGAPLPEALFVERGLLRFYVTDADGREWNKGFVAEDELTGPFAGNASTWPAPYRIQALEETRALRASYAAVQRLCDRAHGFERIVRRYVEALLARKAERALSLQQQDAVTRYRSFLAREPGLARRLPQYHIASYIGMSEVSLSRIRRAVTEDEPLAFVDD